MKLPKFFGFRSYRKTVVAWAAAAIVVLMQLKNSLFFTFIILVLVSCSGGVTTRGAESVCSQSRTSTSDAFAEADAVWKRGDGWKALTEVKEKIDEAEEAGTPDSELYFRRSDWAMRMGAKATARRDVKSLFEHGERSLALLARARYNTFYNDHADALKDVEERRALICEGQGPECLQSCDLQRAFLLNRLDRTQEARAAFLQCQTEHRQASAQCGKFGNALTEYFLGNYDAATALLGQLDSTWQSSAETRALDLLAGSGGRSKTSSRDARGLGLKGFYSAKALELFAVFPFTP